MTPNLTLLTPPQPQSAGAASEQGAARPTASVWGVPFSPLTYAQTLEEIDSQIQSGEPGYFITANLHYIMLADQHPELDEVNREASFIIADGMPIVWRSRLDQVVLPERIAGSDLIFSISELAARKKYRVFFLGGTEGIAESAANILQDKYPGLQVAGIEVPPFRELKPDENAGIIERIRAAQPDILFAALGQPKGEKWLHRWHQQLEVPLAVQLGGSFNFVTGNVCRSPKWIASIGMEWFYRFYREPMRLGPRYLKNGIFLAKALLKDLTGSWQRKR